MTLDELLGQSSSNTTQRSSTGLDSLLSKSKYSEPEYEIKPTPIGATAFSSNMAMSTPAQFAPGDFDTNKFLAQVAGSPLRFGLKIASTLQEAGRIFSNSYNPNVAPLVINPKEDFGEYAAYFLGEEPIETLQQSVPQGGGGVVDYVGQTAEAALGILPLYGSLSTGSKLLTKAPTALRPLKVGGTSVVERIAPNILRDIPEPVVTPAIGKPTKAALDINNAIVESGFRELPVSQLAKFTPITKVQTEAKIASYMQDYDAAKTAAVTGRTPTDFSLADNQVLFNSVKKRAILDADYELQMSLAKSPLATERSLEAQALGAAGFNNNPFDPIEAIRNITKTRIQASTAKYPGGYARAQKVAKAEIKDALTKVQTPKTWDEFVDSITC